MMTKKSNHAAVLRSDLLLRAEMFVAQRVLEPHVYRSLGRPPTVLFRPYRSTDQACHGSFCPKSYSAIVCNSNWAARLKKPHSRKSSLSPADAALARELDSCMSSDALAMNLFCHPSSLVNPSLAQLFGFPLLPVPEFGYKARVPLKPQRRDIEEKTEIDVRLSSPELTVLVECKLTEAHFTFKPAADVHRYTDFTDTFDLSRLPQEDGRFGHYQLIRNVLAARHHSAWFYLICDQRRPDLTEAFGEVVQAIRDPQLQQRCARVTWQ